MIPARPTQSPTAETVAAPSNHPAGQSSGSGATGQPAFQAAAQPAVTTNSPAMDPSSKWPLVPSAATASAAPVPAPSGAVQVSAEASNANTPTLTIVPGRPDNLSLPGGAPTPRMQPIPQPQSADPMSARSAEASMALAGQPTSVYGGSQDRPDAATSAQPVASPFDALDRTKVMSFQFRNAPWSLVLAQIRQRDGPRAANAGDAGRDLQSMGLGSLHADANLGHPECRTCQDRLSGEGRGHGVVHRAGRCPATRLRLRRPLSCRRQLRPHSCPNTPEFRPARLRRLAPASAAKTSERAGSALVTRD